MSEVEQQQNGHMGMPRELAELAVTVAGSLGLMGGRDQVIAAQAQQELLDRQEAQRREEEAQKQAAEQKRLAESRERASALAMDMRDANQFGTGVVVAPEDGSTLPLRDVHEAARRAALPAEVSGSVVLAPEPAAPAPAPRGWKAIFRRK